MKQAAFYESVHDKEQPVRFFRGENGITLPHFHRCIEMLYITEGRVLGVVDGERFYAEKDDVIFARRCAVHELTPSPAYKDYVLIIKAQYEDDFAPLLENGDEVGYTIYFEKHSPINIYHGKNDFICRMIDMQRESAKKHGWEFLDWNKPMTDYNIGKQRTDSTFTICGHDRIHPDNDGHMMMAYIFLKAQGMAGKPVATVCIDAATQSVVEATNCRLSCIERTDKGVQFDYLAAALPYPLDTIARGDMVFDRPQSRIKTLVPDFMKELDSETLRVLNLKKGSYRLTIDDVVIDTIQNYRLAAGVNLAEYVCTPQYRQALTVMMLNEDRWDMERRMRDWAWVEYDYFLKNGVKEADVLSPEARCMYDRDKQSSWWLASRRDIYAKMGNKAVRLACEKYQDSIVDEIYRVNRPVTRHIKLVRVK